MSEFKGTPGPWSYDRGILPPDGPGRYSTVSADGDVVITEVNDLISEGIANARLIAAAPELLDALEVVMGWITAWDPSFIYDPSWPHDRDKARAAIAKALGE